MMHRKLKSSFIGMPHGLLLITIGAESAYLRDEHQPTLLSTRPLKHLWNVHPQEGEKSLCFLGRDTELNHLLVQLFSGVGWGSTHTSCRAQCSDLEDRLMRSAGRCSPLVTFTISPTATYRSQFKIIKMEKKNNRENKQQMDKGDRKFEIIIENNTC